MLAGILIGIILFVAFGGRSDKECQTIERIVNDKISRFESALTEYKQDHGKYPPDDSEYSSRPLIKYLSQEGSGGEPYYDFIRSTRRDGRTFSLLVRDVWLFGNGSEEKYEFHYRRPVKEEGKMNTDKPNLWTAGCDGEPKTINNFE